MTIRAKFKGQDGKLGYKNGQDYTLMFDVETKDGDGYPIMIHEVASQSHGGAIIRLRNNSFCPYSSLRKFLDNWEVL